MCSVNTSVRSVFTLVQVNEYVCFLFFLVFVDTTPQTGLQIFLVIIAVLSAPMLLLGKPLYLYWLYRGGKGMRRRRVGPAERKD